MVGLEFSIQGIQDWVNKWGIAAPAIYFIIVVLRVVILIPSVLLLVVGGFCFGTFWGTLLGSSGILVSALIQFAIGRGVGRHWIEKKLSDRILEVERRIRRGGPLVIGLVTAYPAGVMTPFHWASGFTSMQLVPFTIAVGIGAIIRAFSFAFFGSSLVDVGSTQFWLATFVFVIIIIVPLAHPKLRQRIFRK